MDKTVLIPSNGTTIIADLKQQAESQYDADKRMRGNKVLKFAQASANANFFNSWYYNWRLNNAISKYNKTQALLNKTNLGGY